MNDVAMPAGPTGPTALHYLLVAALEQPAKRWIPLKEQFCQDLPDPSTCGVGRVWHFISSFKETPLDTAPAQIDWPGIGAEPFPGQSITMEENARNEGSGSQHVSAIRSRKQRRFVDGEQSGTITATFQRS